MGSVLGLRRITHLIATCPHCGEPHKFPVLVRVRASRDAGVPLFGASPPAITIAFTCPNTHKIINEPVADPPDGEVIGPDDANRPVPDLPRRHRRAPPIWNTPTGSRHPARPPLISARRC